MKAGIDELYPSDQTFFDALGRACVYEKDMVIPGRYFSRNALYDERGTYWSSLSYAYLSEICVFPVPLRPITSAIAGLPGKGVRSAAWMESIGFFLATKKADKGGRECDERSPLLRVRSMHPLAIVLITTDPLTEMFHCRMARFS